MLLLEEQVELQRGPELVAVGPLRKPVLDVRLDLTRAHHGGVLHEEHEDDAHRQVDDHDERPEDVRSPGKTHEPAE